MKKLIQEIRQQPLHIRHMFMWTMVVITFSIVGFAWFEDTRSDLAVLLNQSGTPVDAQRALAQATPEPVTPFASIKNSFSDLGANISKLIAGDEPTAKTTPEATATIRPQRLPVN